LIHLATMGFSHRARSSSVRSVRRWIRILRSSALLALSASGLIAGKKLVKFLPLLRAPRARKGYRRKVNARRFWTAVPPPSVSPDEPSFSLKEHFDGLRRYWRGPTWINSAWLIWRGLVRLGYEEQAATLARAITETLSREGLREFYDPHDGRGMGATDFAWSALALELLDPANASAGIPAAQDERAPR
jgi:hypothetical protein